MQIIGIDPSLNGTAVAIWNEKTEQTTMKYIKLSSGGNEIPKLCEIFRQVVGIHKLDTFYFLEDMAFGVAKYQTSAAMVQGIIRLAIGISLEQDKSSNLFLISPTCLKKFVTGSGQGKKEDMKLQLYKKWGKEFKSNDEVDAYGLLLLAQYYYGVMDTSKLTEKQKECLSTVTVEEL